MSDPDVAAAVAALNVAIRALTAEIRALRVALEQRGVVEPVNA